jgi:YHS domain-containing protein
MKKILFVLGLSLAFIQFINASNLTETQQKIAVSDTLKKDGIDPICKMKVKAGNTKTVVFEKLTYGFCSESCKKEFVANPKKYIKKSLN